MSQPKLIRDLSDDEIRVMVDMMSAQDRLDLVARCMFAGPEGRHAAMILLRCHLDEIGAQQQQPTAH
jgi:hypothetical protein